MSRKSEEWQRVPIELPRGWHDVLHTLSDERGPKMKYFYTLAVRRLLSDPDILRVVADAWDTQRETQTDLGRVARLFTVAEIEERLFDAKKKEDASDSRKRESATKTMAGKGKKKRPRTE